MESLLSFAMSFCLVSFLVHLARINIPTLNETVLKMLHEEEAEEHSIVANSHIQMPTIERADQFII